MAARLSLLLCCVAAGKADLERAIAATYVDNGLVSSHTAVVDGASIKYLQAGSLGAPKVLLFCHGAAFSARTWRIVGALDAAASQGMAAVAIDLPGYNGSERRRGRAARALPRPLRRGRIGVSTAPDRGLLVVSASMGGTYALPFVLSPGPYHVAGYLTAAGSTAALAGQRSSGARALPLRRPGPAARAGPRAVRARSRARRPSSSRTRRTRATCATSPPRTSLSTCCSSSRAATRWRHLDERAEARAAWGDKARELAVMRRARRCTGHGICGAPGGQRPAGGAGVLGPRLAFDRPARVRGWVDLRPGLS